jgi:DNA polymerase-3 subunit psi
MGVQTWQLQHASRLNGYVQAQIKLPDSCRLLFISPEKPEGTITFMLEKVLKSMDLTIEQTMHLYPEQFRQVDENQLEWLWFSGCQIIRDNDVQSKVLATPLLADIDGNTAEKRNLWKQICSYEN